ncbi:MAG: TonB-dependent receptor [Myxococcales bacterium]|nr:MAG: TonB-dependent receptor [Myxococcales bacterium]
MTAPPASPPPASPAPEPEPAPTEVTIVGTGVARTPGSAHVIGKKQLERHEYDDAGKLLQQVPGVYVRVEDGVGLRPNISIRGGNPDRSKKLTLMEDGILFGPAPYSAPAAYYFPLMTRMTSVRVIKGPAAIAYGPQTVGGAVDFISRSIPTRTTGGADFGFGEYGYNKLDGWFGSSTDQVGFLVSGTHLGSTGFKELPNRADTGSTRNDFMVKASYVVDPRAAARNEFLLKLAYADEVSNESYLGLTDADLREDPDQRYAASQLDQMKNHRASVVMFHEFDDPRLKLKVKSAAYRHDYKRTWRKVNSMRSAQIFDILTNPEDPTNAGYLAVLRGQADSSTPLESIMVGPNEREFISQGVQSVISHQRQDGPLAQRIELGARLHYDEIKRRHSQDGFQMIGGELIPDGTPAQITASNTDSTTAVALHAIDALTWKSLTLTPGVRVEIIGSKSVDRLALDTTKGTKVAWMPGAGAYWAATRDFGLLAGVYRGFSPPPPGSAKSVKPEYSVNYEAGARFSRGPARVEAIAFFNDYSNLTDVCTISSGCVDQNLDRQFDAGKAHIYGLEAFAAHEIPAGQELRFPVSVSYTLTRATFENDFQSQDPIYGSVKKGDEIPYVPKHQLNATLAAEVDRASAYVSFGYVARMREEAGSAPLSDSLVTDTQTWLDTGIMARVFGPLRLYANLRNVLDERDLVARRPFGARPSPPRWLQVGAKLDF